MRTLLAVLAAVLLALLCVPSLTRAEQALDPGRGVNLSSGFSKSGNRPPDPVVTVPDFSPVHLIWRIVVHAPHRVLTEESLPTSPFLAVAGLRAPPDRPRT